MACVRWHPRFGAGERVWRHNSRASMSRTTRCFPYSVHTCSDRRFWLWCPETLPWLEIWRSIAVDQHFTVRSFHCGGSIYYSLVNTGKYIPLIPTNIAMEPQQFFLQIIFNGHTEDNCSEKKRWEISRWAEQCVYENAGGGQQKANNHQWPVFLQGWSNVLCCQLDALCNFQKT